MRISTFGYSMKQGVKNIGRNKMFSIASIATMAACIFLFGLFYAIVINLNYIVEKAEEGVAITVFFNDDATQEQKDNIGEQLKTKDGVLDVNYISAEDAWNKFQEDYFGESKDAAEGFKNDNPLATSDNYEVYMADVAKQKEVVDFAMKLEGVRKVNKSDVLCVGGNHPYPFGGVHFPYQQYGNDGYYRAPRRDCDYEIHRGEGRIRPCAVHNRRFDYRYCRRDYSAGYVILHV